MEKIIKKSIKLCRKASKKGEIPVAAIIYKDDKIISAAYNLKVKSKNPIKHAEVVAIQKATKKLNTWNLEGFSMYVTLEPCLMCKAVIEEARISNVFYALNKTNKSKKVKTKYIKKEHQLNDVIEKELKKFFYNKRK